MRRGTDATVRCRIGDVVRRGRAIRLDQPVEGSTVAAAVRGESNGDQAVVVEAPEPARLHEYVGHIHPGMGLRTRTALAVAERSRGQETPYDHELDEVRESCASLSVESTENTRREHRKAVAARAVETEQLRERVATLRGELRAARDHGQQPAQVATELETAIQELTEVETAHEAAKQRLAAARQTARKRRNKRERRRRLEERKQNLERRARSHLVEQATDRFAAAVDAVPGGDELTDPFEADPVTASLAIAQIGTTTAPLVLCCDRFESATAAAEWLGTPVLKV